MKNEEKSEKFEKKKSKKNSYITDFRVATVIFSLKLRKMLQLTLTNF